MPLEYPTLTDYNNLIIAKLREILPTIDPTVKGSWAYGFMTGASILAQSLGLTIRDLEKQLFPQTAEGEFLDLWGGWENIPRPSATDSTGNISISGTIGTVISSGTPFKGSNGLYYTSSSVATILNNSQLISSLTRVGTLATATMTADHSLATGLSVTVSGANETDYNGTFTISVIERNKFTYEVSGSPSTPATGTISYTSIFADVPLSSDNTGIDTNISGGGILSPDPPLTDVDSSGYAQFDGLSGGSESATDDEYFELIFLSRSNISGVFTNAQIEIAAKSISGNTRVFIKNPTYSGAGGYLDPLPGQVSIFFLRDNDVSILPTSTIITQTKQAIIDNGAMPGHTIEDDIFVQGPTLVSTDFTFASIVPDTPTMRIAVENSLTAFFEDNIDFEENITKESYIGAISNTVDLETGDPLTSFSLTSPSTDITISSGGIGVLGDVIFS